MNAAEFKRATRTISEAGESLTDWLRVSATTLHRWEAGQAKIPRGRVRQIEWLLRLVENNSRMASSGLAECEWKPTLPAFSDKPSRSELSTLNQKYEQVIKEAQSHQRECPVCAARADFAEKHLEPLPPFPSVGVFGRMADAVLRWTPEGFLPVVLGAVGLGGIVSLRFLFLLPFLVIRWPGLPSALETVGLGLLAILTAAAAGAAGGLAVSISRPLLRHLGTVGDYITGVVAVFAYMSALVVVAPLAFDDALVEEPGDWLVIAGLSVFFGLVATFGWRREDKKDLAGTA